MLEKLRTAIIAHGESPDYPWPGNTQPDPARYTSDLVVTLAMEVQPSAESARLLLRGHRTDSQRVFMDTAEFAIVEMGIRHAALAPDPSLFEELLEGVGVKDIQIDGRTFQTLAAPEHWRNSAPEGWNCFPQLESAILLGLIGHAPRRLQSITSIRESITSLALDGDHSEYAWDREFPVDLSPLESFGNLQHLSVREAHPLTGLKAIGSLNALDSLEIRASELADPILEPMTHPLSTLLQDKHFLPGLRRLKLSGNHNHQPCEPLLASAEDVSTAPAEPRFPRIFFNLSSLSDRPLTTLELLSAWDPEETSALQEMPALEELRLATSIDLHLLEPLKELRELTIDGTEKLRWARERSQARSEDESEIEASGLSVLALLPRLRRARIPLCPLQDADLDWLADHPSLEELQLSCEGKNSATFRKRVQHKHPKVSFV